MAKPTDVIGRDDIHIALRAGDKPALIGMLARQVAVRAGCDPADLLAAVLKREELGSTGIGEGVAIPHARLPNVRHSAAVLATLAKPIDFKAVDDRPVDLVILLALPEASRNEALQMLSGISRCLRKPEIRASLRQAKDAAAAYEILHSA